MPRSAWIAIALGAIVLPLSGCSRAPEPPAPAAARPARTLQIGILPEQNIFRQLDRYEPLARYLSQRTGTMIRLKILPRYGNLIDNFESAGLDGAFFGSFTYALAHKRLDVTVIARPLWADNTSTYHGVILVRYDSGISGAADMRGKRFAFVDRATTAGYLLPLDYFVHNGIRDHRTYLKEYYFAGTHEDVVYDVLNRRADVGAAKNTVFTRLAKEDPAIAHDLVVLDRSPDVPENGLALRDTLDPALRHLIAQTLLSMHEDPEGRQVLRDFGALRFIETVDRDYEPVYRYAEEIGLDLSTYDYRND